MISRALCLGQDLGEHAVDAGLRGDGAGGRPWSPVSMTTVEPHAAQRAHRRRGLRLERRRRPRSARARARRRPGRRPSCPRRPAPRRAAPRAATSTPRASMSARLPSSTRPSGAIASTPCPGTVANAPTGGSASPRVLRAAHDRLADADARSPARPPPPARGRRRPSRRAAGTTRSVTLGRPTVSVPVLSKHDGVDAAERLERRGAADQDAVLGAAAGGDHDGRRRGEPHRARAGDDEHGHGVAERVQERRLRARAATSRRTSARRWRARPGRTPPPRGRPAAGWARASPAPPPRAGRSGPAPSRCRRAWPGRRSSRCG